MELRNILPFALQSAPPRLDPLPRPFHRLWQAGAMCLHSCPGLVTLHRTKRRGLSAARAVSTAANSPAANTPKE